MKKLLLKSMLLLCAVVVGSVNGWATDVELFNVPCSSTPTGWTLTGTGVQQSGFWLFDAGGEEYVTTSSYDISSYDKATITAKVATYGSGTNPSAKIEISYNGGATFTEVTTQGSPTSNTYVDISYELESTSNSVVIKVSNSISSGRGLRFKNFVLTGTSSKAAAGLAYATAKYATTFAAAFVSPTLTNPNSLDVTYATSDATIADVNASSGAVTIKSKIGSATITASTEGDATHSAGSASYTIYVFEHDGNAANNAYTFSEAKTFISNELYNTDTYYYVEGVVSGVGAFDNETKGITYYVSADGTSTGALKVVKGKGLNGVDFAAASDMQRYDIITLHGKFNLNNTTSEVTNSEQVSFKRKAESGLVAIADFDMYRETEINAGGLFSITSDGIVSYESSDETIAKVEGGKLKALAVGSATITISVAATEDYREGSDEVVVTVKNRNAVAPEGTSVGGFIKITSTAELTDGDYLIVCESQNVAFNGGRATTLDAVGNYISVTISGNIIAPSTEANNAIVTYNSTDKSLLSKSGSYFGRTTTGNGLDQNTTFAESYANTITFEEGNAEITSAGGPKFKFYNSGANSRFRYYGTAQTAVQLYKKSTATTYDITIGTTGYKTLISAVSATLEDGLTAYKAVSAGAGKINLLSVASIKAGCAYILKGTPSTDYTLTVTNSPEEPTGNILEVSTESSGNGCYVLADGTNGVGFYKWTGGSLGAGRAIVPASAVSTSARGFLEFSFGDEDITSVNELKVQKADNQYFNLAGQRVAQPTKGLYIVNGKKVIIK